MKIAAKIRSWTVGAAAGLIIALLVFPASRGLLLVELSILGMSKHSLSFGAPVNDITIRYPNDFQMQLAAAHYACQPDLGSESSYNNPKPVSLDPIRAFETRFPDNPSTYANILRWMSTPDMDKDRPEAYLETGAPVPQALGKPISKEYGQVFDDAAVKGETLDPNNAYFPMMRSAYLFDAQRDGEAMKELHKAAQDSIWQEYYQDEVSGMWKVSDKRLGFQFGISHLANSAAILFPQFSLLRAAARIALYKAMLAERSGDFDTGIAYRSDLLRCGALMRSQSQSLIGALVANAIVEMSAGNSGGIIKHYRANGQRDPKAIEHLLNDYAAYLTAHGYDRLAQATREEFDKSASIKQMIRTSGVQDLEMKLMFQSTIAFAVSIVLLSSATMFVLSALISLGMQKAAQLDNVKPIVRVCIYAAVLLLLIAAMYGSNNLVQTVPGNANVLGGPYDSDPSSQQTLGTYLMVAAGLISVIAFTVALLSELKKGTASFALVAVPLKTLAVGAAVVTMINFATYQWSCVVALGGLAGGSQPPFVVVLVAGSVVLGPPLVIIAISMIKALRDKGQMVRASLKGLTDYVMPIVSVMLLIYGVALVPTLLLNAKVDSLAKHCFIDETTFYASSAHIPWPGPITATNMLVKDEIKTPSR